MGTNRIYLNGNAFYSAKKPTPFDPPEYVIKGNSSSSNSLIKICQIKTISTTSTPLCEIKLLHKAVGGFATLYLIHTLESITPEGNGENTKTFYCKTGLTKDAYYVSLSLATKNSQTEYTYTIYGIKKNATDYFRILDSYFDSDVIDNDITTVWASELDGVIASVTNARENGYHQAIDLKNIQYAATKGENTSSAERVTSIDHSGELGKYPGSMLLELAAHQVATKPNNKDGFVQTYFWDSNSGYDPQIYIANNALGSTQESPNTIPIWYRGMNQGTYEEWRQVGRRPIYEGSRTSGRIHFADLGYQIVWCEYTYTGTIDTQWGNIYCTKTSYNMNWPYAFSEVPFCLSTLVESNKISTWIGNTQNATATKTQLTYICHPRAQTTSRSYTIRWIGFGKCTQ